MFTVTRKLSFGAALVATTLTAPAALGAQQRLAPVRVTAAAIARADALDAKAEAYERRWRHIKKAAKMREQSAELRAPEDPQGVESLRIAANLRYLTGSRISAADLMERAADRAIARGDVLTAVDSYVVSAIVAAELRQGDRVRDLVQRADVLMHSPLLSEAQRSDLRSRIARGPGGTNAEVAALLQP